METPHDSAAPGSVLVVDDRRQAEALAASHIDPQFTCDASADEELAAARDLTDSRKTLADLRRDLAQLTADEQALIQEQAEFLRQLVHRRGMHFVIAIAFVGAEIGAGELVP